MSSTEFIEIALIVTIIAAQILIFFKTRRQIGIFRNIVPEISSIKVSRIMVPVAVLERVPVQQILEKADKFKYSAETAVIEGVNLCEIAILEAEENDNPVFQKILYSVNTYLLRNRGAAPDFHLIKDIIERNTQAVEEDISLTISIPLYLGLMGTMLGIVIGLFSMSELSGAAGREWEAALGQGISVLLGGVKIAMFASFSGLLLTTVNSGAVFKGSKSRIEARKNEFYTFIQTELLPVINQSFGATFESLQRNLLKFNSEFTVNLSRLSGIFDTNYEALKLQDSVLANLQKVDIATIAEYNIDVLRELQTSTKEFENFNLNVALVNTAVSNSSVLINRINELLTRTDNVRAIAANLEDKLSQSQALIDFVSRHFQQLEDYKQLTNDSVAQTGFAISETFVQLKDHIERSSKSVQDFTVQEVDLLKNALSERKSDLSNLQFLEGIKDDVSLFKDSTASQGERIRRLLESLGENIEKSNERLERIERINSLKRSDRLKNYVRGLFKSNGAALESVDPSRTLSMIEDIDLESALGSIDQIWQESSNHLPDGSVFYLPAPDESGTFDDTKASPTYEEGISIYKFTKSSNGIAEFEIDGREESVRRALESPDEIIDSACIAQGAFDPKASRIVTGKKNKGKAELAGSKWTVKEKAKIKFESAKQ